MLVRIRPEAELLAAEREFVDCLRAVPTTCLTLVDVRVDRGSRRVDAVLITPRGMTVAEVRGFQRRQSGILSVRADRPWTISGESVDLDRESSPSEQLEHGVYAVRTTLERALLDPGHVCGFVALLPYRGVVVRPARTNLRPGLDVVVANVTDTAEFRSYIEEFGDEPAVWDVDRVLGAVDALDMGEGLSRADLRADGFDDRDPGGPERRRPAAAPPPEPATPVPATPSRFVAESPADTSVTAPVRTPSGAIPMPAPPGAMGEAPPSEPPVESRASAFPSESTEPPAYVPPPAPGVPPPPPPGAEGAGTFAPPPPEPGAEPAGRYAPPPPEPGSGPSVYAPPPPGPGDGPPDASAAGRASEFAPPPGTRTADAPPPGVGTTDAPPNSEPAGGFPPPPSRLGPGPRDPSAPPPGAEPVDSPPAGPRPARLNPLPPASLVPPLPAQERPAPNPQSRLRNSLAWVVLAVAVLGLLAVLVVIVTAQTTDDGVSEPSTTTTQVSGSVTVAPTTTPPPAPNACFPFQTGC